jgi:hypothetical protein
MFSETHGNLETLIIGDCCLSMLVEYIGREKGTGKISDVLKDLK